MTREQKKDKLVIVKKDAIVLVSGKESRDVIVCSIIDGHLDLGVYDNVSVAKAVKMVQKSWKYEDKKYISVIKFEDRVFAKAENDKFNYEAVGIEEFMDTLQVFDIREYSNVSLISNNLSRAENGDNSNVDIVTGEEVEL